MSTPTRAVRVPDDLWDDAQLLTADADTSASEIMVEALRAWRDAHAHELPAARRRAARRALRRAAGQETTS